MSEKLVDDIFTMTGSRKSEKEKIKIKEFFIDIKLNKLFLLYGIVDKFLRILYDLKNSYIIWNGWWYFTTMLALFLFNR